MKKSFKRVVKLFCASISGLAIVSCGAKETTTVLEAEKATLKKAGVAINVADKTDESGTYVRLSDAWQPTNPEYILDFVFTSDKAKEATLSFKLAAPITDISSGNMGSILSEMYGVKFNNTAIDVSAWDSSLGEAYDVTAENLKWVDVTAIVTLVSGQNDIQFYTIEKSGQYGDYTWHCTDSVCIDNVSITTTATLTIA